MPDTPTSTSERRERSYVISADLTRAEYGEGTAVIRYPTAWLARAAGYAKDGTIDPNLGIEIVRQTKRTIDMRQNGEQLRELELRAGEYGYEWRAYPDGQAAQRVRHVALCAQVELNKRTNKLVPYLNF